MHLHREIILTVIIVIPVHVTTTHQEATVREMDMVEIVPIQIIQVEVPTEIHIRVMVTHAAHPLSVYGGSSRYGTTAHVMATVEVKTVIQAAEVISTQVATIVLADKNGGGGSPTFCGKRYPPPRDSYSSSSQGTPRGGGHGGSRSHRRGGRSRY